MDTQTRHALKGDKFAQATQSSVTWISGHRCSVVRWAVTVAAARDCGALELLCLWCVKSATANVVLGAAMDMYSAPLLPPGAPPETGVYATAAERSKAANQQVRGCRQRVRLAAAGDKGALLCRRHLPGTGPERPGGDGAEEGGRFVGSQYREPCQACPGRSLPPDESRRAGDRSLQRDRGQAVGDGVGSGGAARSGGSVCCDGQADMARAFCGPR